MEWAVWVAWATWECRETGNGATASDAVPANESQPTGLMTYTASIASLKTRSDVRGFLASELHNLIGGEDQKKALAEFSDLATGSDREVIESFRRFDKSYDSRGATDTQYPRTAMSLQIRDLFAKALQRMKELPPDPRETMHLAPPASPIVNPIALKHRTP